MGPSKLAPQRYKVVIVNASPPRPAAQKQRAIWPLLTALVVLPALMLIHLVPNLQHTRKTAELVAVAQRRQPVLRAPTISNFTYQNFDRVQERMSLADVEELLGGPGQIQGSARIRGHEVSQYVWTTKEGQTATVITVDGMVGAKAQKGF